MTWNLHGSHGPNIKAVAETIGAEAPDVVVLQEVRRYQAFALGRATSMRYSWVLKHYPYTRLMWWRAEGMAIMTPHGLGAAGQSELTDQQPMGSWKRRIAHWATVRRADQSIVTVYNTHLSPHDDAESRRNEARRLRDIVTAIGDDGCRVVAGDFNDGDDPTIIEVLPGVEHVRPAFTNPADVPVQLLDHVLVPADATDVTVSVPTGGPSWAAISDHLPVTVRFTITPGV